MVNEPIQLDAPDAQGQAVQRPVDSEGRITVLLKYPVSQDFKQGGTIRTEKIQELKVRRLKGADYRAVMRCKGDEEKALLRLFVNLTGHPEEVFDKLDGEDVLAFAEVVEDFLPQSPET